MQQDMSSFKDITGAPETTTTTLHIEVEFIEDSSNATVQWLNDLRNWIQTNFAAITIEEGLQPPDALTKAHTQLGRIAMTEAYEMVHGGCRTGPCNVDIAFLKDATLHIHPYHFIKSSEASNPPAPRHHDDNDDSDLSWYHGTKILNLPTASLDTIWEGLIYDFNIKSTLLSYVRTLCKFSKANINMAKVASFNKLILLHGPPGSGKTSLARGLAQKLSIRLFQSYRQFTLLELNGCSLLSKYYSESGRTVARVFQWIFDISADSGAYFIVLIDEIETLIASRHTSGDEARESMRVVNALLTGLDKLLPRNNVLIITTSNLVQIMDPAFVDRVDINELIASPQIPAAYTILSESLSRMMDCGIITPPVKLVSASEASVMIYSHVGDPSSLLWECATKAVGLSGRTLKKLAGLMHVKYIQTDKCSIDLAVKALGWMVEDELEKLNRV